MSQEQNITVEVQPSDTIDSLNQRLIASGGRSINLVVSQSAPVPSTLPEFEQLRELERKAGLRLNLLVDPHDPTRLGLAKILGFSVSVRSGAMLPAATSPDAPAWLTSTPPDVPVTGVTASRLNESPLLPDDDALPADIAGMNFDTDELDAAMPSASSPAASLIRPRIMGANDATLASPRDHRAERSSRDAHRDTASSRPTRFTAEPITPPAATSRDQRVATTPTTTGKAKIKAKTSNSMMSSEGAAPPPIALAGNGDRATLSTPERDSTTRVAASRPPSQSKTAAAAIAVPSRAIGSTGRSPVRADAATLRHQRESSRRLMFAAFIVLLFLLLGGVAYLVLNLGGTAPAAVVSLTPRTVAVSQQVSVPITINGQARLKGITEAEYRASPSSRLFAPVGGTTPTSTLSVTATATNTLPTLPNSATAAPVAAQPISVVISETSTISTTGTRPQPTGNDHTTLKIVNPSSGSATIGAGTRVSGGNTSFFFPSAVVIPASNLLGGVIGTSYVRVQAEAVGPTHVAAYTVNGTIGTLQYQNTDDASGATIINIPIISEADYNNLVGGLIAKVNARLPDAINAKVQSRVLITQTVATDGDPQVVTDHKVGDDGSNLTAVVTRSAHAYVFDLKDASNAASLAVQQSIVQAAHNLNLDPASIKVSAGQLQPVALGYVYQASASASATYTIDAATLDGVRQLLVGHKASESIADLRQRILARYPAIADVQIMITPGSGNNDGILNADKITVQPFVSPTHNASGTAAPAAATATH